VEIPTKSKVAYLRINN